MLAASGARIEASLAPEALLLDVGAGADPFPRADWVLDLMSYEQRSHYQAPTQPRDPERFSAATWVQRDMCAREPWPFEDDRFDFAVCSHTLEDVRDPIWVCSELARVARAGYIEVPSRLEEQSYGFQGPWAGWGHHRWLIDPDPDAPGLVFVAKHHVLHNRPAQHFPAGHRDGLSESERVLTLWWERDFRASERIFWDGPSLDAYLEAPVTARTRRRADPGHDRVSRPLRPSREGPGAGRAQQIAKDWLKTLKVRGTSADT